MVHVSFFAKERPECWIPMIVQACLRMGKERIRAHPQAALRSGREEDMFLVRSIPKVGKGKDRPTRCLLSLPFSSLVSWTLNTISF